MATQLGEAVVRILADSSAFDRAIKNLGKNTASSLEAGTKGLSSRAADIGERFGSSIGRVAGTALKRGLQVAAVGVAAAVGTVLVKGFKRFTTIQDATASLTLQLGDATKAASLLGKVLKVVEGTPFALDQFVDAARNLVAASVPLEKVPRILQAVGDAAAAAGGSAQDVNDVVDSIGRLATGATATLGPIRELEAKGVPALRILANQAGISATDMAKQITAGSVDSKKAIDDLVDGILNGTKGINGATVAFGGAALAVGNTVSGAFSNMQTAIARAGAKIITVFNDSGKGGDALVLILNGLRETIDILGDVGVRAAERLVGSRGFGRVLNFFEKLPRFVEESLESLREQGFGDLTTRLIGRIDFGKVADRITDGLIRAFEALPQARVAEIITKFIIAGIAAVAENAAQITAAILRAAPAIVSGVVTGLVKAFAANPIDVGLLLVAMGLPGIGKVVTGFLASLFAGFPFGKPIAGLIRSLGGALQKGFSTLFTAAFGRNLIGRLAFGLVNALRGLAPAVGSAIAGLFSAPVVLSAIAAGLGVLAAFLISKIGGTLETALKTLLTINPATRLVGLLAVAFDEGFSNIGSSIAQFFTETVPRLVTETIPSALGNIVGAIGSFFAGIDFAAVGNSLITGLTQALILAFAGVPALLTRFRESIVNFFRALPGQIGGALSSLGGVLLNLARSALSGMSGAVSTGAQAVLGFFARLPGQVGRALAALPGQLQRLGASALSAMARGIAGAAGAVLGFFRALPGRIIGAMSGIVGQLASLGRQMISALASAITGAGGQVVSALVGVAKRAWQAAKNFLRIGSPSKLFLDIGDNIGAGLALGIERSAPQVQRSLSSLIPTQIGDLRLGEFRPVPSAASVTPTAAIPSGLVQNITVNEAVDADVTAEAVAMRLGRMVNT